MKANQMKVARVGIVLLFCYLFASTALAQNVQFTQGSVDSGLDHTMQIPIQVYPGRGGSSLPVTLNYSSRVWRLDHLTTLNYQSYFQSIAQAIYAEHSIAGWKTSLDLPIIEWPKTSDIYFYSGGPQCSLCTGLGGFRVRRVYIHMPDGSTHELRQDDMPRQEAIVKTGTFYAVDGSRLRYDSTGDSTGTLYLPNGTRYVFSVGSAQIIDRNGNTLNYDAATRQWTDTLGRAVEVPLPADPSLLPQNPDGSRTFTYKGKGVEDKDRTYTLIWKNLGAVLTPDPANNNQVPDLRVVGTEYLPHPEQMPNTTAPENDSINGNKPQFNSPEPQPLFTDDGPEEGAPTAVIGEKGKWAGQGQPFNPLVLAEVQLPNGLSYKFSYNVYGEINKVTYPTGAYDTYQYKKFPSIGDNTGPYTQANRGVSQRQLSTNVNGTDLATWTYDSTGSVITMTSPDGTVTESYRHNFIAPLQGNRTPRPLWVFGFQDARNGMVYEERVKASATGPILRRKLIEWEQTINNVPPRINPQLAGDDTEKAYRNARPAKEVSIILDTGGSALAKTTTYTYDTTYELTTGLDQTGSAESYYAVVTDQNAAQTGGITLTGSDSTITIPEGALARSVVTTYQNGAAYRNWNILGLPVLSITKDGDGNEVAKTETSYDDDAYSPLSYGYSGTDYTAPDATAKRGMATTIRRWANISSNISFATHTQFDQFGNPRVFTNERGKETLSEYSPDYDYAYPTQVSTPVPDSSGTNGLNAGLTSRISYDKTTGLTLTTTDANGQVTSFSYKIDQNTSDPLNRLRQVESPDGGLTKYTYNDALSDFYVLTETKQDDTHSLKTYQYFDSMGRTSRSFLSEGSNSYIVSDTKYDQMGRICGTSTPYRVQTLSGTVASAGNCTAAQNWTTNAYDALGRITLVSLPDNLATVQTSYQGIYTTVTDQAGRQRRQMVNSLGRIVRVDEPDLNGDLGPTNAPKQPTSYEYDTLGNLVHVAQNYDLINGISGTYTGAQHRYFKYDSLSRLTYERQVEQEAVFPTTEPVGQNNQWTRKLVYDENGYSGLLTSQYDARKIHTQYTYDNLNRVTGVTYTKDPQTPVGYAETPTVSYFYDNTQFTHPHETRQLYNLGRLTKVKTDSLVISASNTLPETTQAYNYDSMGRVANNRQMVGTATPYYMLYTYNQGGALKSEQYPSERVTSYDYDAAARLSGMTSGSTVSASQFKYDDPRGLLSSFSLGNGTKESYSYNSRLQVQSIELSKGSSILQRYEYKYGEVQTDRSVNQTKNNGQIGQIESFVGGQKIWQQQFQYDSLGRLSTAAEHQGNNDQLSYQINYDYDQFGNRFLKESRNPITTYPMPHGVVETTDIDPATNRFTSDLSSGVTYDRAGNVLVDTKFTGQQYLYDANNRQQQVSLIGGTSSSSTSSTSSSTSSEESLIISNAIPPTTSVYDGLGQRVARMSNGNVNQVMVYDALGKLVAEYGQAPVYMDTMMADLSGTHYVLADHHGSTRVVMDEQGGIIARHDYEPFGREIYSDVGLRGNQGYGAGDGIRQKYAGMETDETSSNSHTLWREYESLSGRWTTPDPYGGSMSTGDPQSFNRYTYVNNDPVNQTDLSGLMPNTGADVGWSGFEGWGGGFDFTAHTSAGQETIRAREAERDGAIADTMQAKLINDGVKDGTITRDQAEEMIENNPNLEIEGGESAHGQQNGDQFSANSIMVIIWNAVEGGNIFQSQGHVSYITMEDDTSYSWQSGGALFNQWTKNTPSSKYTDKRSEDSAGRGYILDFGPRLNAKFIDALKSAYGKRPYDPITNNCGKAFNKAINSIRKELGIKERARMVLPSKTEAYIQRNLSSYVRAVHPFPMHPPDEFVVSR